MRKTDLRGPAGLALAAALSALATGCPAGSVRDPGAPHFLPARATPRSAAPKDPTVDNLRCFACHANYEDEPLVQFHAAGGVGCERCHGESKVHTNDEDNVTAPEIMYPREKINAACLQCHPDFKLTKDPGPAVCTDCHFKHRLARRDRVWDKNTGKLLSQPPANRMTGTK
jgi:DNA-directed RNA polymerase subunit RPC12/RpoP